MFSLFFIFLHFVKKEQKKKKREKQRKTEKNKMTSRNIFSIENQMQVIPLARNRREKNENKIKKKNTTQKENKKNMSPFCNLYPITAMQFMFGKLFPEIML